MRVKTVRPPKRPRRSAVCLFSPLIACLATEQVLGVIEYMNVPAVRTQYNVILHRIRWVLAVPQYAHFQSYGADANAVGRFDEWWGAHTATITANVRDWAVKVLEAAAKRWGTRMDIMASVDTLSGIVANLAITPGYYPTAAYQANVRPPAMP